jgi:transposase
MTHIAGHDRSQTLLLPESLDEYVGQDNPVRFIDAFVDGLDLTAAGFIRVEPKTTGRPGYAPDASGVSPIGIPKRQGALGLAR